MDETARLLSLTTLSCTRLPCYARLEHARPCLARLPGFGGTHLLDRPSPSRRRRRTSPRRLPRLVRRSIGARPATRLAYEPAMAFRARRRLNLHLSSPCPARAAGFPSQLAPLSFVRSVRVSRPRPRSRGRSIRSHALGLHRRHHGAARPARPPRRSSLLRLARSLQRLLRALFGCSSGEGKGTLKVPPFGHAGSCPSGLPSSSSSATSPPFPSSLTQVEPALDLAPMSSTLADAQADLLKLLASLPPTEDPYAAVAAYLRDQIFPTVPYSAICQLYLLAAALGLYARITYHVRQERS